MQRPALQMAAPRAHGSDGTSQPVAAASQSRISPARVPAEGPASFVTVSGAPARGAPSSSVARLGSVAGASRSPSQAVVTASSRLQNSTQSGGPSSGPRPARPASSEPRPVSQAGAGTLRCDSLARRVLTPRPRSPQPRSLSRHTPRPRHGHATATPWLRPPSAPLPGSGPSQANPATGARAESVFFSKAVIDPQASVCVPRFHRLGQLRRVLSVQTRADSSAFS